MILALLLLPLLLQPAPRVSAAPDRALDAQVTAHSFEIARRQPTHRYPDQIREQDAKAVPAPANIDTYWVDVYTGPEGTGYVITYRHTDRDGVVWERSVNRGPEKYREQGWREVAKTP